MGPQPAVVLASLWAMAAVSVMGCNGLWGVDDLSYQSPATASGGAGGAGGGAGSGGDDGGGGTAPSCLAGYECRPDGAGGQYVQVTENGSCAPGQTTLPLTDCLGCSCNPGNGGSCTVALDLFVSSSCEDGVTHLSEGGTQGSCSDLSGLSGAPTLHGSATAAGTPASCIPAQVSVQPTSLTACTAAPAGPCDGGICVPASLRCLLVGSQNECPAPYGEQRVVHPGGTTACTCSCTATATCPSANVWTYPGEGCDGGGQVVPTNGSCHDTTLPGVSSAWLFAGSAVTECAPAVMAEGALLLCCLPSSID